MLDFGSSDLGSNPSGTISSIKSEAKMQSLPSMHDPPLTQKEMDEIEEALDDLHDTLVALS